MYSGYERGEAYLALHQGRRRAKAAYSEFLNLWKDADSNIPVLREASLEYGQFD